MSFYTEGGLQGASCVTVFFILQVFKNISFIKKKIN